jgi:hypothetical protein
MASAPLPTAPSEPTSAFPPQVGPEAEQHGQGAEPANGHDTPSEPA